MLWLDFHKSCLATRVGKKVRARCHDHMTKNKIDTTLTPIERISIQISVEQDDKYKILKTQFPVIPAEAITIHKSQGQTYDNMCRFFSFREANFIDVVCCCQSSHYIKWTIYNW